MARGKTMYLLERIKDCHDFRAGERIWAHQPCKGWRIIRKMRCY